MSAVSWEIVKQLGLQYQMNTEAPWELELPGEQIFRVIGLVTIHASVFDINFSIVAEVIESNQVPSEISIGKLDINRIMDTRFWQRRGHSTDYDWIDQIHIEENSNNGFSFDSAMNILLRTPGIFSTGTQKSVEDIAENEITLQNIKGELTLIFTLTEGNAE
jgi:hypothetical protein